MGPTTACAVPLTAPVGPTSRNQNKKPTFARTMTCGGWRRGVGADDPQCFPKGRSPQESWTHARHTSGQQPPQTPVQVSEAGSGSSLPDWDAPEEVACAGPAVPHSHSRRQGSVPVSRYLTYGGTRRRVAGLHVSAPGTTQGTHHPFDKKLQPTPPNQMFDGVACR